MVTWFLWVLVSQGGPIWSRSIGGPYGCHYFILYSMLSFFFQSSVGHFFTFLCLAFMPYYNNCINFTWLFPHQKKKKKIFQNVIQKQNNLTVRFDSNYSEFCLRVKNLDKVELFLSVGYSDTLLYSASWHNINAARGQVRAMGSNTSTMCKKWLDEERGGHLWRHTLKHAHSTVEGQPW